LLVSSSEKESRKLVCKGRLHYSRPLKLSFIPLNKYSGPKIQIEPSMMEARAKELAQFKKKQI